MSEVLAPAGSFDALIAALRCGADAVYIGGSDFSARKNAKNFNDDEVKKACDLCHLYGAKLHIALNTVIFDSEIKSLLDTALKYAEFGADAFIMQDIGAVRLVKQLLPDIPIHASTQLSVHSLQGAWFLKENGFDRAVVSRELSLAEITEICKCPIEVEVFVHGALCMSVSGQCYMSAFIGSRSANRGLCAQPCRLPYSACNKKECYPLSLKDLSIIDNLSELKKIGVSSFKIEGRMKRPEYTAAAVTACRQSLDGKPFDAQKLKSVFSRSGFTDGYYTGKRNNMFGIRSKDDVVSAEGVLAEYRSLYDKPRKISSIDFNMQILKDKPLSLTARDNSGITAQVTGDVPETAVSRSADREFVTKQLSKLGGTIYEMGSLSAEIDENLSVSASALNNLRRSCIENLNLARISSNTPSYQTGNVSFSPKIPPVNHNLKFWAEINSPKQLCSALNDMDKIIIPALSAEKFSDYSELSDKFIISPPRFIADENKIISVLYKCRDLGFKSLICTNPAYIKIGSDLSFTLFGDFSLNITNSESLMQLKEYGLSGAVISPELKFSQIRDIAAHIPKAVIAYGRLPLMLTRNCPLKNCGSPCGNSCPHLITDRTGRKLPVKCYEDKSFTAILNPDVLWLADKLSDIQNTDYALLKFTDESSRQISEVIKLYKQASSNIPFPNITRGLYYRGIK